MIYLPFSIKGFIHQGLLSTILTLLWQGNEYALWYLWGTVIATLFVVMLYRLFRGSCEKVVIVSLGLFFVGLFSSTWNPLISKWIPLDKILQTIGTVIGSRGGLLYGSVYVSLGLWMSRRELPSKKSSIIGFIISMILLMIESLIFVMFLKTEDTILWLSLIPATWFLVSLLLRIKINIPIGLCKILRKMSTVMYVSQYLFIIAWSNYVSGIRLFVMTTISTMIFSGVLMLLGKRITILKFLY